MIKIFTHILESFQIRIIMSNNLFIKEFETMNDFILVSFSDETESIIPLEILRKKCPCADCSGEVDALGNLYKGPTKKLNDSSFQINGIQPVGYYGLRPFWKDGHSTGIFTIELLKELSE